MKIISDLATGFLIGCSYLGIEHISFEKFTQTLRSIPSDDFKTLIRHHNIRSKINSPEFLRTLIDAHRADLITVLLKSLPHSDDLCLSKLPHTSTRLLLYALEKDNLLAFQAMETVVNLRSYPSLLYTYFTHALKKKGISCLPYLTALMEKAQPGLLLNALREDLSLLDRVLRAGVYPWLFYFHTSLLTDLPRDLALFERLLRGGMSSDTPWRWQLAFNSLPLAFQEIALAYGFPDTGPHGDNPLFLAYGSLLMATGEGEMSSPTSDAWILHQIVDTMMRALNAEKIIPLPFKKEFPRYSIYIPHLLHRHLRRALHEGDIVRMHIVHHLLHHRYLSELSRIESHSTKYKQRLMKAYPSYDFSSWNVVPSYWYALQELAQLSCEQEYPLAGYLKIYLRDYIRHNDLDRTQILFENTKNRTLLSALLSDIALDWIDYCKLNKSKDVYAFLLPLRNWYILLDRQDTFPVDILNEIGRYLI